VIERASSGRIDAHDVDELQRVVQPFEVVLRQISPGQLHARMDYVLVNGIVVYREQWSHRILATGATPPGYFFFGGPISSSALVGWCGSELGADCLAFARASSEIDFVTPDAETHVCLLVPEQMLARYLGEELTSRGLPRERFLACANGFGTQLLRTMDYIVDKYSTHRDLLANARTRQAIEWQLMGGLSELLITRRELGAISDVARNARYPLVRRAIELCDAAREPISVPDLAAACGVSRRVLELGFQQTTRTTPSRFMRWNRMNRVRKELRASNPKFANVTDVLTRWGVTELGRFAVEYKSLFGQSPSLTLAQDLIAPARRLADALETPSNL
jgi:AraC family ethanolamine operon transcriptional activator